MDGTIQRKKARADQSNWQPQTRAVRGGQVRSNFDETSEALFLTSGYAYNSAEEAEATFKGESTHLPVFALRQSDRRRCSRTAWPRSKAPRPAAPPRPACRLCSSRCWRCSRPATASSRRASCSARATTS